MFADSGMTPVGPEEPIRTIFFLWDTNNWSTYITELLREWNYRMYVEEKVLYKL